MVSSPRNGAVLPRRMVNADKAGASETVSEQNMNEQKAGAVCVGEVLIELTRGADGRFAPSCGGDTFNAAIYLARAGLDVAFASAVGDDPYSDSMLALAAAEGVASDLILRVAGRQPGAVPDRERSGRRTHHALLARRRAGAQNCSSFPTGCQDCRTPDLGASYLFLRHHAVALFDPGSRPFSRRAGSGAAAGRQGRLRRQFPPARLEGRLAAHPHRLHRSAQARRYRAADLRRRGGAVGRSKSGEHGRAAASLRHRRNRGQERAQLRLVAAGGGQEFVPVPEVLVPVDRPRPATPSMPAISRRGCQATVPAQAASAAHRLAGNVIRHPGALMPRIADRDALAN